MKLFRDDDVPLLKIKPLSMWEAAFLFGEFSARILRLTFQRKGGIFCRAIFVG